MKKQFMTKLRSLKGESISEVLVALLISSLALVMLAAMIATSSRLILNSKEKLNKYYAQNDALSVQAAPEQGQTGAVGKVTLQSGANTITLTDGETQVYLYSNGESGSVPVISYTKMP